VQTLKRLNKIKKECLQNDYLPINDTIKAQVRQELMASSENESQRQSELKFTSVEDFDFLKQKNDPNGQKVDTASNVLFMSLLRSNDEKVSYFQKQKQTLATSLGVEAALHKRGSTKNGKEDSQADLISQAKSGPTVPDKVPSFYLKDQARYLEKFKISIEQRKQKKILMKKLYKDVGNGRMNEDYYSTANKQQTKPSASKSVSDKEMKSRNFRQRRPPSRGSRPSVSNVDFNSDNYINVSELLFNSV
jgi:hypothetical protein